MSGRVGFSSETVVIIALDTAGGELVLAELNADALGAPGSPRRACVASVRACRSGAEVVARCGRFTGQ